MTAIQQGDQYAISFQIKLSGEVVTPDNVDDVRIQVRKDLRNIADASLVYNSNKETWDYFLTEEMTRTITASSVEYQVGIKIGNNIRYSPVKKLPVGQSIIKDQWSNG